MAQRAPRPETARTAAAREHARPDAGAPGAALEPEILNLIRRAAALPNGLALLEKAPLECVAVLLAIHPRLVERGRSALGRPPARAAAVAALAHARRDDAGKAAASPSRAPSDPEDLIREAERRPGGLELVASASPESAAILFGVRPALVLAARALLTERGQAPHAAEGA